MSAAGQATLAVSLDRRIAMLRTAMGPVIAAALEDPDVVEVMLNPDRTLWVDRLSSGRAPLGAELSEADGERIIRLVAAHVGVEVHRGKPLLSAELPETGERFEGILPPAAPGPAFALRKRAVGVIPLERYVTDGMMTAAQAAWLREMVRERQNILIAGGTRPVKPRWPMRCSPRLPALAIGCWCLKTRSNCSAPLATTYRFEPVQAWCPCANWCARRCGCVPTVWWWERCAVGRRWTSSRFGAPVTRAASPPSMPAPLRAHCCDWNSWCWRSR